MVATAMTMMIATAASAMTVMTVIVATAMTMMIVTAATAMTVMTVTWTVMLGFDYSWNSFVFVCFSGS
jgi:hypothetical protein